LAADLRRKATFSLDHFSSSHELNLTRWALDHRRSITRHLSLSPSKA
jgi:hypothetical protein